MSTECNVFQHLIASYLQLNEKSIPVSCIEYNILAAGA